MSRRVLGRVGVMEVGHLFVPVARMGTAKVRPWHKRTSRSDLELRLKGVRAVGVDGVRLALVHQKDRDRLRPRRECVMPPAIDLADSNPQLQPSRGRHVIVWTTKSNRHQFFSWLTLPDIDGAAIPTVRDITPLVVAPAG